VVPITDETVAAIEAYLGEYPHRSGLLFRSYKYPGRGVSPTWVSMMIATYMKDAGLKRAPHDGVSAHAGRHTAAGELLDDGADLRDVQGFLGHDSIATTNIYTRRRADAARIAALDRRRYTP
jgi:integrase